MPFRGPAVANPSLPPKCKALVFLDLGLREPGRCSRRTHQGCSTGGASYELDCRNPGDNPNMTNFTYTTCLSSNPAKG